MSSPRKFHLVLDFKAELPGCALIQAAMGGESFALHGFFPGSPWALYPTDDMKLVEGTEEEFRLVAETWAAKRELSSLD